MFVSKIHFLVWYVTWCTQSNCSGRNINFIPCASAATTFAKRTQQHYKIFVFVLDQIITLGKGAKNWYSLVLSPKPVIASVTAEAMFEAKPLFFANCISCICQKCKKLQQRLFRTTSCLCNIYKGYISRTICKRKVVGNDNLQNLNKNDPYWQFPERLERQFVTLEKNDPSR